MKTSFLKIAGLPLLAWCVLTTQANAETAFFDGDVMHVPELLVFDNDTTQLLQQVELQRTRGNRFALTVASNNHYTNVQSISADSEVVRGDVLVIDITGEKSLECVTLNPVSTSRVGNDFHLVLTEQPVPAHVTCIAVTDPFMLTSTIDTSALEAGTYGIHMHGLHIEVTVTE